MFPNPVIRKTPKGEEFPINFSNLITETGTISVLRDDLLEGGTKSRALRPYLIQLMKAGYRSVGYASPFAGFAQVALAHACRDLGLACELFAERDAASELLLPHPATQRAIRAGANVSMCATLAEAESRVAQWASEDSSRLQLPLGFDCRSYEFHLRNAIEQIAKGFRSHYRSLPNRVWVALGSGTLTKALRLVFPRETRICAVDVHVLSHSDERIRCLKDLAGVDYHSADESFHEPAQTNSPIPSNLYYDAKVWTFLWKNAQPGDLWWNVAR